MPPKVLAEQVVLHAAVESAKQDRGAFERLACENQDENKSAPNCSQSLNLRPKLKHTSPSRHRERKEQAPIV